ncbi:uncharacterized protein LOC144863040 [Branchiostoma floridae x Branchiostoma japonicum]
MADTGPPESFRILPVLLLLATTTGDCPRAKQIRRSNLAPKLCTKANASRKADVAVHGVRRKEEGVSIAYGGGQDLCTPHYQTIAADPNRVNDGVQILLPRTRKVLMPPKYFGFHFNRPSCHF